MRRIKSKNTAPELAMRKLLAKSRVSFKSHPRVFGHPDFLVDERVAIFVDSGFWHGKNWKKLSSQLRRGARAEYWVNRIRKNRRRDRLVNKELATQGYVVLRFWDADVFRNPGACSSRIVVAAKKNGLAPASEPKSYLR